MSAPAGAVRHRVRLSSYAYTVLFCALVMFISHLWLMNLPYFWDEAGQFIPAALDILHSGAWIPQSAAANIHPPAIPAYLAAVWRVAGFDPVATRSAMLALASLALMAAFLLAIELSKEVRGTPAFLTAGLLAVSPVFFAQAMLAQLDAPAMLFTALALLLFLQDRIVLSAAACTVLVLVKETGLVVPLVFAAWLLYERRWREAACFAAPAAVLAIWVAILFRHTGHWMGNPEFVRYNLYYPWRPSRLAMALFRRLYYLFFANLHWLGGLAILFARRNSFIFRSRSWRIAWLLVGAHIVLFTVLGGAVLERYLLPVLPIVYAAMAAGLSLFRVAPRTVYSGLLLAGVVAGNFINPPYPFPYEDNLAFTDFVRLHTSAAEYLTYRHAQAHVDTIWPMTVELSRPDLGYVSQAMDARTLPDLSAQTIASIDWEHVQVLVAFSRDWDPPLGVWDWAPLRKLRGRFYGYVPDASRNELRMRIPIPREMHFDRGGQWADIYVNPSAVRN